MKKIKNKVKFLKSQRKSEKKTLKKRRRTNVYADFFGISKTTAHNIWLAKHDEQIIKAKTFALDDFLNENGHSFSGAVERRIVIPDKFLLESFHLVSFNIITSIRKSIMKFKGEKIYIDFTKCTATDYSCVFLLYVILVEYQEFLRKMDRQLQVRKVEPKIIIVRSKDENVNAKLLAGNLIPEAEVKQSFLKPASTLNFIKGRKTRKDYMENLKGPAATTIRKYINSNLKGHGFILDEKNSGYMDGIIAEVLNNAEDHSEFDTWYVSGNIFKSEALGNNHDDMVSELNLAFLNFGYSIFDGLEDSKEKNVQIYEQMMKLYENMKLKMTSSKTFSKEEMFTLYALQEGISRLKYQTEDRGTGTMKILKSFISLGDYVDPQKGIQPSFLIYSGKVFLKCDHNLRPFKKDGVDVLSLNKENDLTQLPEKSHLKKLENNFPGTLLVVKLYINKRHLQRKFRS